MKKQINNRRQSLLLVTIAIVISLGASTSVFAQKAMTAKYPKPDFTVMEEYWEVVEYEYDHATTSLGAFIVVAKKKEEKVPRWWVVTWRDAKGVKLVAHTLMFDGARGAKVGEPVRGTSYAPDESLIPRIKSVIISEHEDPNWAWNGAGADNTLVASLLDFNRDAETGQPKY